MLGNRSRARIDRSRWVDPAITNVQSGTRGRRPLGAARRAATRGCRRSRSAAGADGEGRRGHLPTFGGTSAALGTTCTSGPTGASSRRRLATGSALARMRSARASTSARLWSTSSAEVRSRRVPGAPIVDDVGHHEIGLQAVDDRRDVRVGGIDPEDGGVIAEPGSALDQPLQVPRGSELGQEGPGGGSPDPRAGRCGALDTVAICDAQQPAGKGLRQHKAALVAATAPQRELGQAHERLGADRGGQSCTRPRSKRPDAVSCWRSMSDRRP